MRPELIVAGKEFRDHVTSKRFLIIFAILLLVCAYAIVSGMDNYNKTLDNYKQNQQQPWFQQQIAELQKQITDAQARGDSQEMIDSLQSQIDSMLNPSMPSILTFFYSLGQYFALIGMVLGIALGFDLITREKEEGSLKSLLSHPVYRDSVINGKTLGAIAVLVTSMGAAFLLTLAIVLFFGVVPSADEFLRIAALFIMALLFCLTFFAVAMAASTVAKNSSMAVLFALGIVFGLTIFGMFSNEIVQFVTGPPPESGPIMYTSAEGGMVNDVKVVGASTAASIDGALPPTNSSTEPDVTPMPTSPPKDMPGLIVAPGGPTGMDEWQKYYERQELIRKALDSISPMTNFQNYIAQALISDMPTITPVFSSMKRVAYQNEKSTVWDALGSVWVNILVMLAEMMAAFGIAYVKFLRTDIR
jgi:ABC-2 type transport system permease protein